MIHMYDPYVCICYWIRFKIF